MFAAGMKPSMNAIETPPSANATGMPESSRIRAQATKRIEISWGVIGRRPFHAAGGRHFLEDLYRVLEREQRHAESHQRVRYPQRRRPDRVGGPAFAPCLPGVLPDLHGDECAQQERQDVAEED